MLELSDHHESLDLPLFIAYFVVTTAVGPYISRAILIRLPLHIVPTGRIGVAYRREGAAIVNIRG